MVRSTFPIEVTTFPFKIALKVIMKVSKQYFLSFQKLLHNYFPLCPEYKGKSWHR